MSHKPKILIISPGIEDAGMRGLGRVTLSLIDGLAAAGYEPYLLTGAPVVVPYGRKNTALHAATVRRSVDHYLSEGLHSSAFRLTKLRLLRLLARDTWTLFVARKALIISGVHPVPTQHQPTNLRHFSNVAGFVNFSIIYRLTKHMPKRFCSAVIYSLARRCSIGVIVTSSPYPLLKPIFQTKRASAVQYVHDVMPLNIMETPPDSANRFAHDISRAVNNADFVITSSVNAKDKLQTVISNINPRVVYLPCSPIESAPNTHGIGLAADIGVQKGKYMLFMSAVEKRKNVARLLEAFSLIASKTDYKLVVVGSRGYGWDEIEAKLNSLKPKVRQRVILTGYVSEEDKWSLLSNCGLVVFPTIDEGFGIPVIEALLSKKPVVATRLTSIEEFAPAGCVTYIEDPYNAYEIADKLLLCIKNKQMIAKRLETGSEIVADVFSEHAFSQRLKSVLDKFVRA